MTDRSAASISAILTVGMLIFLAIVLLLLQMVLLNGFSEKQGMTAMGLSLACQSIVIILLSTLAARATDLLITKVNWNRVLAIAVTVLGATMIGGTISFLASLIAIPIAGIR